MPSLDDFKNLSERYYKSAKLLFENGQYDTSYYLAGYSVECLIKAVICKKIKAYDFPPPNTRSTHYIHGFEQLIKTAGIDKELQYEVENSDDLKASYTIIKDWDPGNLRYEPALMGEKKSKIFLEEIENTKGFFIWLKTFL